MRKNVRWKRQSTSAKNFDLVLIRPEDLDSEQILQLLDRIEAETHRGLSLSGRASREFRRWAEHPDSPLKSDAFVMLSNWFCTNSGDRRSMVASRCEDLWDELFPSRPTRRLSSPEPGRNHAIVPAEFDTWWRSVLRAQGDDSSASEPITAPPVPGITTLSETDASHGHRWIKPLTIADAKAALAETFGVSPDQVEITIRG